MEVQIAPETRAALEATTTVRFLYHAKFHHTSRLSAEVIPWAESKAKEVISEALQVMGQEARSVKISMVMIQLRRTRKPAMLCFDVVSGDDVVSKDDEQPTLARQPIHEISRRGEAYYLRRSRNLDPRVAAELRLTRSFDKGPLPYFVDSMNPPMYDDGRRVEGPLITCDSPEVENEVGDVDTSKENKETSK